MGGALGRALDPAVSRPSRFAGQAAGSGGAKMAYSLLGCQPRCS